ncbi:MAG: hypothetical protein GY933_17255 [Hyphomicrobiales bacterium]|nr:hypothetical protein [Hyphomicrobiales bacterium]
MSVKQTNRYPGRAVKSALAALCGFAGLVAAGTAAGQTASSGLFILHSNAQNEAFTQSISGLADDGCSVWRRGAVAGTQGGLDVGAPQRFVLLSCDDGVLGEATGRDTLAAVLQGGAVAVEGPILLQKATEAAGERAYIFKISRYNNADPSARENDLAKINAVAADTPDAWANEGFVAGLRAAGIETPDEVVVIHYEDRKQGERFRNANQDILQQVGAFNRDHLVEFVYIAAVPDQGS